MNSLLRRLIAVAVSLFLLCYVGYQAFKALYDPVSTTRAQLATADDSFQVNGFVLHTDSLVTSGASGIIDYVVDDGERVEKNGLVAQVYPSAQQAADEREIREIDTEIAQLQVSAVAGDTAAIDISVLDDDIRDKFRALSDITSSGQLTGFEDARAAFLNLLNEKQVVTGKVAGFSQKVAQLQAQRARLAAALSSDIVNITTPVSGYFVSQTDGYENIFNLKNIKSITVPQVQGILAAKPAAPKAVGRVIASYEWYVVAVMDTDSARRLKVGESVDISFPYVTQGKLPATVAAINGDGSGNFAVAIECDNMSADLASQRAGVVSISLGEYTGLKVQNSEIRFQNGVKGVYILDGNIARFRRLNVLYTGASYVISGYDPYNSAQLQVNDRIIDGGSKIYDGKVVK